MRTYSNSTVLYATATVAFVLLALTWFIAVPAFLTLGNFIMVAGLVGAFGWVLMTTLLNAQPDPSVAQALHDSEVSALDRARKIR